MTDTLTKRRTYKVIGDPSAPHVSTHKDPDALNGFLKAASNAPFHYACDRSHQVEMSSPVPWRAYVLDTAQCGKLMDKLIEHGDATKVPAMLAAAECLVQVTWLPDPREGVQPDAHEEGQLFDATIRNMEHLAAAGAFTQSLLLAANEGGYKTYWSSGGALRRDQVFQWLGIPSNQILIGSVFIFPDDTGNAEVKAGALRDKRGSLGDWSRSVSIS